MKQVSLFNKIARGLKRQEGQLLIEVLIALVILGIVVVAFLSGLATSSRAIIIADERTTAESLTRTQLEDVKNQAYEETNSDGEAIYTLIPIGTIPSGYYIYGLKKNGYVWDETESSTKIVVNESTVAPANIIGVIWDATNGKIPDEETEDTGIQIVTVVVYHEGRAEPVLTTTDYKVDR